jgi:hypothetical protein
MLATTSQSHEQKHEPKSPATTTTTDSTTTTATANNLPPPNAHRDLDRLHHRPLDSRGRDIASLHPTSPTPTVSSYHSNALPSIGDVTYSTTFTHSSPPLPSSSSHSRQQKHLSDRQSLPPPSYSPAERPAAAIDPLPALGSVDRHPPRRSSHDDHERSRNNSLVLPSLSSITGGPLPGPDTMMLNQQPVPSVPQWPHPSSSMTSSQHSSPPSFSQIQSRSQSQSRSPLPPPPPAAAHAQRFDSPATMELDTISNSGISAPSPGRASSVSLDDPDVRLAAEALGDLRAGKWRYSSFQ